MEANTNRYGTMEYRRCGDSGLLLPALSFGLWHNFGDLTPYKTMESLVWTAFNAGITCFDLANNYGPEPGKAEENFGRILKNGLIKYRDELVITTKAGYTMWEGPYGDWGSRKYLISSLDQSLKRLGIPYVDIFYHHRPDPKTPVKETALALADIVRSGKALYIGLSNYSGVQLDEIVPWLEKYDVPFIICQNRWNILDRKPERQGVVEAVERFNLGMTCFSPLAQGILTNRYLEGIPKDSRIATDNRFLKEEYLTPEYIQMLHDLNDLALANNMSMAQMALKWLLQQKTVTSVLIGASKPEQILENVKTLGLPDLSEETLEQIEKITKDIPYFR